MRVNRQWSVGLMALLAASCGGGGGGGGNGGGGPPPPPPPALDLAAALDAPAAVLPGESFDYQVEVSASGGTAQAVEVRLTLPAGVAVVAISGGGTETGGVVTWPQLASLAAGSSISETVTVSAPSIGPLDANLEASTSSSDGNAANDTDDARTVLGFEAIATLEGEAAPDGFGFAADAIGDITGDGIEDFVVGAPASGAGGSGAGRTYVYSGADVTLRYTFTGQAAGENFGWSVASAGDADGDGVADIAVGGPSAGAGVVRVFSGASGDLLHELSGAGAGSNFGFIVAGIGDVDGDDRSDLLVGAPDASGGRGEIRIVSGLSGTTIRSHTGTNAGDRYGYGGGAVGDVSGDGIPDYAAGAAMGGQGVVAVRSGADGSLLYAVNPLASSGQLGFIWIDSVGDVNGDGRPDIFAGDINDSGNRGRGHLISGADGATIRTFAGDQGAEFFGIARHGGHDADGDGVPDLFIAGYHNAEGATLAGKAYVYSGATGTLLRSMTSTIANETLGYDAVQLGDVNGDGFVDYLLTGDIEQGTTGRGRVYVVRGTALP
jgi:hypothetical protein